MSARSIRRLWRLHQGGARSPLDPPTARLQWDWRQVPVSVPSYLKITLAGLPGSTLISCDLAPYLSCQASMVYQPGGTGSIRYAPGPPVTHCRGFREMPMYP